MELTGDLSDFPLADILQILALSRKTGTLSLEAGGARGRIIIEDGRITQATLMPGESLAERIAVDKSISRETLESLKSIVKRNGGMWSLESIMVESGLMTQIEVQAAARRHVQSIINSLVILEKGRFGIDLNHADSDDGHGAVRLSEGLEIGEVLLEAAHERDKRRISESPYHTLFADRLQPTNGAKDAESDNVFDFNSWAYSDSGSGDRRNGDSYKDRRATVGMKQTNGSLLCSFLAELGSYSFEAEVSLLVMRYASEVSTRGVLFVVREGEVGGLGQYGLEPMSGVDSPDARVREIRIPLGFGSILDTTIRTGQPYIGKVGNNVWDANMLARLGGGSADTEAFVLPITCNGKVIFLVYGDNYPESAEFHYLPELIALVNQSSLVLEKIVLERIVRREWLEGE